MRGRGHAGWVCPGGALVMDTRLPAAVAQQEGTQKREADLIITPAASKTTDEGRNWGRGRV